MYKYCTKCGTKNESWNFCPSCGASLKNKESVKEANITVYKGGYVQGKDINEELDIVNGIIEKFEEELKDAEADEETLLSMPLYERKNPEYKKAWNSVQERKEDLMLSLKLMYQRREKLKNKD